MTALRTYALKLLAGREHSRFELEHKLMRKQAAAQRALQRNHHDEDNPKHEAMTDQADITALLDDFEQRGWLSDARSASSYVNTHAARLGRYRLENALRERGIDDALINQTLATTAQVHGNELARARAIWQRKFGGQVLAKGAENATERAKQARFLQRRGFAYEVIRLVVQGLEEYD